MNSSRFQIIAGVFISSLIVAWATTYSEKKESRKISIPFLTEKSVWIDSSLRSMSQQEKIAQLLMLVDRADSAETDTSVFEWARIHTPGGVAFKAYSMQDQYKRMQRYHADTRFPLLIGKYSDPVPTAWAHIPRDLSLTAIHEDTLITQLGQKLAQQSATLGVHLQFFPSYAQYYDKENKLHIARTLTRLSSLLQEKRITACPLDISPYILSGQDSANYVHLVEPYQWMSQEGMPAMALAPQMIHTVQAHFHEKDYYKKALNRKIQYQGLLISAIEVQTDETATLAHIKKSLTAGSDMFLVTRELFSLTQETIQDLLIRGYWEQQDLDQKVRRVLQLKNWATRHQEDQPVAQLDADSLNQWDAHYINQQIRAATLTVLRDTQQLLPFTRLRDKKIHMISIGEGLTSFLTQLRYYGPISNSTYKIRQAEEQPWRPLPEKFLSEYGPLIIAFHQQLPDPVRDVEFFESLRRIQQKQQVVLVHFGGTDRLPAFSASPTLVHTYNDEAATQVLTAQLLFGGIPAQGKLPQELSEHFAFGMGISTPVTRLNYTFPEAVGIDAYHLAAIDTIVREGLQNYAMPGCQVLVAKAGHVIYHKAFGHHTYARKRRVWLTDLYDLASITKVAATTVAAMDMYNDGRLKPQHRLSRFFKNQTVWLDSVRTIDTLVWGPDRLLTLPQDTQLFVTRGATSPLDSSASLFIKATQRTALPTQTDTLFMEGDSVMVVRSLKVGKFKRRANIFQATIGELMTHTSGLPAAIPIRRFIKYKNKRIGKYDKFYAPVPDSIYSFQVAANFHLRQDYWDSLWQETMLMPVSPGNPFEYSDANMILVQQAIDSLNEESIGQYLKRELYERLGIQNMGFNPRKIHEAERLIPTEYDRRWRGQLLRGYVHDPSAALLGGIAGNAGLFSNANDLAILFQMLLNGGAYGGESYFSPQSISMFTQAYYGHRGLGFDKPPQDQGYIIAESASPKSFGHTGFTGTCVWADPDEDLVFIFLSNRIHPNSNNWKLNTLRIRQRIHQAIYDAILASR